MQRLIERSQSLDEGVAHSTIDVADEPANGPVAAISPKAAIQHVREVVVAIAAPRRVPLSGDELDARRAQVIPHAVGREDAIFGDAAEVVNARDLARAAALLTESLGLHRDLGHMPGLAQALLHLGWVALDQGTTDRAASCFQESLALARSVDH